MNWEERKQIYNAEYYDGELEGHYRKWWWTDDFVWGPRARVVYELYHPRSVLVCGCAKGSLVQYLCAVFGIDAYGFDLSEYAISNTPFPLIRNRLSIVDAAEESLPYDDRQFDVVVAFDIIEHLDDTGLAYFVAEIKRVAREYILIRAPMCMLDDSERVRISKELRGLSIACRWERIIIEPSFRIAVKNVDDPEHPNALDMVATASLFRPEFTEIDIPSYVCDIMMGNTTDTAVPVVSFFETLSLKRNH